MKTRLKLIALALAALTLAALPSCAKKPAEPASSSAAASSEAVSDTYEKKLPLTVKEGTTITLCFGSEKLRTFDANGRELQLFTFVAGNYAYCRDELATPDLNGDGAADLFFPLLKEDGVTYYECHLYDEATGLFLPLDGAADIPDLVFEGGCLHSTVKTASGCSYRRGYRIENRALVMESESLTDAKEVALEIARKKCGSNLDAAAIDDGKLEKTGYGDLIVYRVNANEGRRFLIAVAFTMNGDKAYTTTDFVQYTEWTE